MGGVSDWEADEELAQGDCLPKYGPVPVCYHHPPCHQDLPGFQARQAGRQHNVLITSWNVAVLATTHNYYITNYYIIEKKWMSDPPTT